ncbi:hypothetical protein PCANC_28632, partial [Puccinia coronata f. sp. avenae]
MQPSNSNSGTGPPSESRTDSNSVAKRQGTAGINRSNTAVRAVLKQPCSTGGWTGTVRPKHLPAGRTGLSDQLLGPVGQDQPGPVGQICPTSWLLLRSDSARPTTGRTRLFEHRSNCRVRPVNAGSALNQLPLNSTLISLTSFIHTSGVFYVANSENNGNSAPHNSNTIGDSQNFTRQGYYEFTQNQFVSGFNHGTSGLNNANGPLGNGAQPAALPGDHPAAVTLSGTPPAAAVLPVVHPAITVLPGAHPAATTLLPGGHPAASVLPVGHTAATPLPGVHPTATGNTQPAQHGNSVQSAPSQKTKKKRGPYKKQKRQSSTGPANRPSVPILSSGPANATASPTSGSNDDSGTNTRTSNQTPNPTSTGVTTCTNSEPRQTGNCVTQSFQDADHHVIQVVQSATCKNKRITNSVKDELRLIMLDYQKQVQLVSLRSQICAELLFKWLGVYNKSRTPNRFNNFCRYSPDARKLFGF